MPTREKRHERNEARILKGYPHLTPQEFEAREKALEEEGPINWAKPPRSPSPMPVIPGPPLKRQRIMAQLLREERNDEDES
jgi:hypothetical protein